MSTLKRFSLLLEISLRKTKSEKKDCLKKDLVGDLSFSARSKKERKTANPGLHYNFLLFRARFLADVKRSSPRENIWPASFSISQKHFSTGSASCKACFQWERKRFTENRKVLITVLRKSAYKKGMNRWKSIGWIVLRKNSRKTVYYNN